MKKIRTNIKRTHLTEFATIGVVAILIIVLGLRLCSESGPAEEPTPAQFEVSELNIEPDAISTGENVNVSVKVTNVGELEGIYSVVLKINDVEMGREEVTLTGGKTTVVSFTRTMYTKKICNISVNGLTGTFMVFEQPTIEVSYDKEYYYQEEIAHDTIRMTGVVYDGGMDVTVYYALYNPRGEQILGEPTGAVHHLQETGMTEPVEYTCHVRILDTYPPGMYTEEVRVVDHISNQEITNTTTFELIYDRPVNYQRYVQDEISEIVGLDLHPYGGHEEMTDGRVYFIMWHEVDWKTYRYWAVEIDRESLEIVRCEEIGNDGPNYGDLWWVPER